MSRTLAPMTRFGIYALVSRTVAQVTMSIPSLKDKRISPHSIRHYVSRLTMSMSHQKTL